jgi:hypothetical protein
MELEPGLELDLEKRQITLELPPSVWSILDGANGMAASENGQGFEEWLAEMTISVVIACMETAHRTKSRMYTSTKEGNA